MSLENKGRIRILRGNAQQKTPPEENPVGNVQLYDGQPFYDTASKHLYIGDGKNTIGNTAPIIADANNIIFYCGTAGDIPRKEIDLPGYKLINGQRAFILFANDNTALNIDLEIMGNEPKDIIFNGYALDSKNITNFQGYILELNRDEIIANEKLKSEFTIKGNSGASNLFFEYNGVKYQTITNKVGGLEANSLYYWSSENTLKVMENGNWINTDYQTIKIIDEITDNTSKETLKNISSVNQTPSGNIKGNALYQLEYKDDVFYISEVKTNKNILIKNQLWPKYYETSLEGREIPYATDEWLTLEFNEDLRGRDLYFRCGIVLTKTSESQTITSTGVIFKTFGPYNYQQRGNEITNVGFYEKSFAMMNMNSMAPDDFYNIIFHLVFVPKEKAYGTITKSYDYSLIEVHAEKKSDGGLYLSEIYEMN